jgi:hypothetical protein
MKLFLHVLSYCAVAGGLLPVLLGALPEVAQPVERPVDRAEALALRALMLRVGDGKAIDGTAQVELRWLDQNQAGLAAPLPVTPKFARQGRFELLPNWEVGRVAMQLLPNYEAGMASFELVARPELATISRTPALTPIAPSRQAPGESDD